MGAVRRLFGYIHVVLSLLVAVQFILSPMYAGDANDTIWEIISYLMAVGVVAALVFSFIRVRESEASPSWDAQIMLVASLALFLLFGRQWLAVYVFESEEALTDGLGQVMWYVIDVLFVIVNLAVGRYLLWRSD